MCEDRAVSESESGSPWVAVLTPRGRGAIASVLLNARQEWLATVPFRPARGGTLADLPRDRIAFGHWGDDAPEEVVVCRTSERRFEIHCHGGVAAVERILRDLRRRGASVVDGFAAVRHSEGLVAAAVLQTLAAARSLTAAQTVMAQRSVWQARLNRWRRRWQAAHGSASVAPRTAGASESEGDAVRRRWRAEIGEILRWTEWSRHLVEPFVVVVTGPPNAGKSSLVNRLLGYERAIVYDRPGTTRDVVTGETVLQGWPVRLADTAGVRQAEDALEREGIRRARSEAERADLVVWLDDRTQAPVRLPDWTDVIARSVVVEHKSDRPPHPGWQQQPDRGLPVSSRTGEGLERLVQVLIGRLVPASPEKNQPLPLTPDVAAWLQRLDAALQHGQWDAVEALLAQA